MEEADNEDEEAYEQELAAGLQDRDKDSHSVDNIDDIDDINDIDEEDDAASYRLKGKQKATNTSGPIPNNIKEDDFKHSSNSVTQDAIATSNFLRKQDPESNNSECIQIVPWDN
ncbi:hypothetical protein C0991_002597, partial [Blastosporella zonata]